MLRFSLGVTKKSKIIKETLVRFGQKGKLRWYGHVKCRDVVDYGGRKVLDMQKTVKTKEEVFGRGKRGHAGGRSEGR